MRVVYKYPIGTHTPVLVQMPMGAHVLAFALQGDEPCIWALVNPKAKLEARQFVLVGTGHELPDEGVLDHIGTIHPNGFVFHLFEIRR